MTGRPDPLALYLDVLFARARPSTLVEVRWRVPGGMGRRFLASGDRPGIERTVVGFRESTDVYVGVLPRWRRAGGRKAIAADARTVWVDLDNETAARALEPVEPAPTLVVASGGPGHLHAYWTLARAVPPSVIERANRRLAWAVGGDPASTDAPRILRPPSTFHHGRGRAPVTLAAVAPGACRLGALVGGLLDPPDATARMRPGSNRRRGAIPDPLLGLEPERYVSVLTGQRVAAGGKVCCPLHDDRTASLHVYADPQRGWFCFGCRRGGSVYDLASGLWSVEARGRDFVALRQALLQLFA